MKEIKIYEIPNIDFVERIDDPYIGMIFYVTDIDAYYSVKTLKEINGINMKGSKVVEYVIDEYADFRTGSGGGSGLTSTQLSNIAKIPAIQATVDALPNNYASKNHNHSEYASSSHRHDASEIDNLPSGGGTGLTSEQTQQLQTAYEHSQSTHVTSDDLLNIDAVSLNGKKFSNPMTKVEYDAIDNKDSNTIYLIDDDYSVIGVPNFTQADTGKYLAVNSDGTALAWVNAPSGSGSTSTIEIINDLTTGGTDKALSAEQGKILKNEVNTVISDYLGNKKLIYLTQTEYNSLTEEEKKDESVVYNITDAPTETFDGILTSENGTKFKLVVSNDGTLSTEAIRETVYGEIVLDKTSLSLNEGETGTFTVSLDKAPTSEEAISISVNNSNCTVNPSSLSFTSSNYSDGQEVTVTAIHDSLSYENKTDTIILSNDNVSSKMMAVTINNIDKDPNALSSISAVYTQGDTIVYPNTSLDSLKSNLVVTATYNNNRTETVTDYTLSGTLVAGTSTITVTYNDKTTTFNVTVSEISIGDSNYYVNLDFNDNSKSPIITNLADNNYNASMNQLSIVSWENGVIRTNNTSSLSIRNINLTPTEMSIEIVFQLMDESKNNANIFKLTSSSGNEKILAQFNPTGINIYPDAVKDGNKVYLGSLPATFNITEKKHIIVSLKSGETVLYVNGSETYRVNTAFDNLNIKDILAVNYNFDGTIELFKIYKKALSSDEVTSAYNNYSSN